MVCDFRTRPTGECEIIPRNYREGVDKIGATDREALRQARWVAGRNEGNATPTAAEAAFLELALAAWRGSNGAGRRALREHLKNLTPAMARLD